MSKLKKAITTGAVLLGLFTAIGLTSSINAMLAGSSVNNSVNGQVTADTGSVSTTLTNQASTDVLGNSVMSGLGLTTQTSL